MRAVSFSALAALALVSAAGAALPACSEDALPPTVAADVGAACGARARWTRPRSEGCLRCQALAVTPACDCPDVGRYAYASRCEPEIEELRAAACPDAALRCRVACAPTDCGCIAACYEAEAACEAAQGKVDACVVESCRLECE